MTENQKLLLFISLTASMLTLFACAIVTTSQAKTIETQTREIGDLTRIAQSNTEAIENHTKAIKSCIESIGTLQTIEKYRLGIKQ